MEAQDNQGGRTVDVTTDHLAQLCADVVRRLSGQPWARVLYTTRLAPDDFTKAGAMIRPLDLDRLPENQAVDLCGSPDSSALPNCSDRFGKLPFALEIG